MPTTILPTLRSILISGLFALAPFSALHAQDPALDEQARQQGVPVDELRAFAEVMERIRATY
jgi:carboxyl-terminal processing protease